MESPKPTTPLCRRTLPLAHVATQIPAATWRNVLRAIRTARPALSVSERPLASATLTRPSPKNTCSSSSRTTVSQNRRHGGPDPATPTRALRGRLRYRQPGQPPRRARPTKGQGREEHAPGGFRFRPAGTVGPRSLSTPSRTSAVHAPPARPRSPTQTLCRRTPIQSSAASRWNDATNFSRPHTCSRNAAPTVAVAQTDRRKMTDQQPNL